MFDYGRRQLAPMTFPLTWDPVTTDWALVQPSTTDDVVAEVWHTMELVARNEGWPLPSPRT